MTRLLCAEDKLAVPCHKVMVGQPLLTWNLETSWSKINYCVFFFLDLPPAAGLAFQ